MAIQLTSDQEQRIDALVRAGVYPSTEDALDAAVAALEAAAQGFEEGGPEVETRVPQVWNQES
jgi:Arc/MetJ-type ribon-helix-helix transcriptional regulator